MGFCPISSSRPLLMGHVIFLNSPTAATTTTTTTTNELHVFWCVLCVILKYILVKIFHFISLVFYTPIINTSYLRLPFRSITYFHLKDS